MGDKYLIFEYTNFTEFDDPNSNVKEKIAGTKQYWTSEGMAVFPLGDDIYSIAQLDIAIRKRTGALGSR